MLGKSVIEHMMQSIYTRSKMWMNFNFVCQIMV